MVAVLAALAVAGCSDGGRSDRQTASSSDAPSPPGSTTAKAMRQAADRYGVDVVPANAAAGAYVDARKNGAGVQETTAKAAAAAQAYQQLVQRLRRGPWPPEVGPEIEKAAASLENLAAVFQRISQSSSEAELAAADVVLAAYDNTAVQAVREKLGLPPVATS